MINFMPELKPNIKDGKFSPLILVRDFFEMKSSEIMAEKKADPPLSKEDILELGSAVARQYNLPVDRLTFEPVTY